MLLSIVLGTVVFLLFYRLFKQNYEYWRKRKASHDSLFSSKLKLFKKRPQFDLESEKYLELGTIYGYLDRGEPVLSVGDPELLEEILKSKNFSNRKEVNFGDEFIDNTVSIKRGEDAKRARKMMIKASTPRKLKEVVNSVFEDCVLTAIQNFRRAAENGKAVDLLKIHGAFTMETSAIASFSLRENFNEPDNILKRLVDSTLNRNYNLRQILAMKFMKMLGRYEEDTKLRRFIRGIIQERKRSGEEQNDFLKGLLDFHEKRSTGTSKPISMEELVSYCVSFLVNGYDPTSYALSFASYLLAMNQNIQDKLRAEVDAEMERNNDHLTHDEVNNMLYLDKVVSEALRMYPPSISLERQAAEDYKLGNTGIVIPKGMLVDIPVFAIHRNPRFWPNPERFDPERFSPEEKEKRNKFSYLPFGAGHRKCLGESFAVLEVKFCLAYLIRHFKINTCPGTGDRLELFSISDVLLKAKEIKVTLEPRDL